MPWPVWLSVTGVLSHRPEGCGFDSWSWHMPRWWVWSWLGHVREETNWYFSPFLSPSRPLSLKSVSMSLGEDKKKRIEVIMSIPCIEPRLKQNVSKISLLRIMFTVGFWYIFLVKKKTYFPGFARIMTIFAIILKRHWGLFNAFSTSIKINYIILFFCDPLF